VPNTLHRLAFDGLSPRFSLVRWGFDFLPAAKRFFAPDVLFLPLDFRITFDRADTHAQIATASSRRVVVPSV